MSLPARPVYRPVVLIVTCIYCIANARNAADEFRSVLKRYRAVQTLSGSFEQTTCSEQLGYCSTLSGRFYFSKPCGYRFEVFRPEKQLVVGDSSSTWFYWPDSNLARRTGPIANPFFQLFLEDSEEIFVPESLAGEAGFTLLTLTPVDSLASFHHLRLLIDPRNHSICEIVITDIQGNKLHYRLSAIRYNHHLPSHLFRFTPPKGTVIEE